MAEVLAKLEGNTMNAQVKASAAVQRATMGSFGPVVPPPEPFTAEHKAAAELAALSYQYRWRATTVRVTYGRTAAQALAAATTGAAGAGVAPTEWSVSVTSPIQELKRDAHAGLYDGVERVFAAAWPILRTLYNWRSPAKRDGCDDGFAQGLEPNSGLHHDSDTCHWCCLDADAERDDVLPDAKHARTMADRDRLGCNSCPFGTTGMFAYFRSDDERSREAHDKRHDVDTTVNCYSEGAPHPFRDFAGPQPPDERRPVQATPPIRLWKAPPPAVPKGGYSMPHAPPSAGAQDFQVVVKAQKVVIQPGATYQGVWHDEGLHERIIAVIVYYYAVPDRLSGGGMQFASKGSDSLAWDASAPVVRSSWRARSKCVVDVKERQLLVFSNYQTVHRVLAMHNASDKPVTREFVCLFVVDPRHPLPTTTRAGAYRDVFAAVTPLPPDVVCTVLEFMGEFMGLAQRLAMRRAVFTEQMRPKQLGGWVLFSNGNGDCQQVVWGTANDDDSYVSALLRGTSSDEPKGADGYSGDQVSALNLVKSVPGYERVPAVK